ncbi:HNH endonuclease [Ureibacillus sp. NPDC094379]
MPTIDHIEPIAQGGTNDVSNLICTSMMRNSAKSNFTLKQLGWEIHPRGNLKDWDGLVYWFLNYVEKYPDFLQIQYIKQWYSIAKKKVK